MWPKLLIALPILMAGNFLQKVGGVPPNGPEKGTTALFLVERQGKVGFANRQGTLVIPAVFDEAKDFSEGLAPVQKDKLWSYINPKGESAKVGEFKAAEQFNE